jgi:hypothetical protein
MPEKLRFPGSLTQALHACLFPTAPCPRPSVGGVVDLQGLRFPGQNSPVDAKVVRATAKAINPPAEKTVRFARSEDERSLSVPLRAARPED